MTKSSKWRPRGVLCDMDGTLLDTEALSLVIWARAAREMNLEVSEAFIHGLIGLPVRDIRTLMAKTLPTGFPTDRYIDYASQLYKGALHENVPLKPGTREFLSEVRDLGLPLALCTSTAERLAHSKLEAAGLTEFFQAVWCGDQVERGKPAPDIYLQAAKSLQLAPTDCLAIEDSSIGLQSAAASGAKAILIPDVLLPPPEIRAKAWREYADLLALLGDLKEWIEDETILT